ncbi:MAG: hypothetical protein MRJ93_04965 [Nitrososphaeraceae archaeon]|nr:hypothetical protein [Nitrososphaeraceae archaeon]
MVKGKILAMFLAVVLISGAITLALPSVTEDVMASSDKKYKKDKYCNDDKRDKKHKKDKKRDCDDRKDKKRHGDRDRYSYDPYDERGQYGYMMDQYYDTPYDKEQYYKKDSYEKKDQYYKKDPV